MRTRIFAALTVAVVLSSTLSVGALEIRTRTRGYDIPSVPDAVKWPWLRLPDLRIGRWWYKAPPKVGEEVDFLFEIENVGRGIARGPILWEATCHNWGFWNPVLNRLAVSYTKPLLLPGQSRMVHLRFRMTREMHNLTLMVDPSDHLGPPDNPPFGQKALLHGWLSLKDGHIKETDERNNSKWVCIKVFGLKPGEITKIAIPVVNPYPESPTEVVIEMDKELVLPEGVLVGLPATEITPLAVVGDEPVITPVEPGQPIANFKLGEETDEEEVVLLTKLVADAVVDKPIKFKVLGAATGPDGEPIFGEVTVVLEMETATDIPLPMEEVAF